MIIEIETLGCLHEFALCLELYKIDFCTENCPLSIKSQFNWYRFNFLYALDDC